MSEDAVTLRAAWVFPGDGSPILGGTITYRAGRIERVGPPAPGFPAADLGDLAIIPGLVNAHAHLEFSGLSEPLGHPGMAFPDWIRCVVAWRRAAPEAVPQPAIAAGLAECAMHGATLVGEIANADWPALDLSKSPGVVAFRELLGLKPERLAANVERAERHLAAAASLERDGWLAGLSPHAPYTVSRDLLEFAVQAAQQTGATLAMHLAESPEEMELLATGGGPMADLLRELDAWAEQEFSGGLKPLDCLERLSAAPRSLVIHGNFLDAAEQDFLAQNEERMSVVYCPRTHAYFGHPRHPLPRMLERGVNVALGTDSRASNPDLSLLAEARCVARTFPELSGQEALELATVNGARALGYSGGVLRAGLPADFALVALGDGADPYEQLLGSDTAVQSAFRSGIQVWPPPMWL